MNYKNAYEEMKKLYELLQQENKQLQERMEYLERSNNRREDTIIEQRQEISDLEDNWNKLKEFMEKEYDYLDKYSTPAYGCEMEEINRTKNKMQEIEQGSDSNE